MENEKIEKCSGNTKFSVFAAINFITLIAVVILFVLHFTNSSQTAMIETSSKDSTATEGVRIVHVNSDEIVEQYYLTDILKNDFEKEKKSLENEFVRRQRTFQKDVETFQTNVQQGKISNENAMKRERELMLTQQELYELNESFTERLMMLEMEMQKQITDSLTTFLARYNQKKNYDYILGYARGGGILFANPGVDITQDVIEELKKIEPKK